MFLLGTHKISLAMQEDKLGRPVSSYESWDSMRMMAPDLSQPLPQLPEYFGTAQEDGANYLEAMIAFNPELDDPRSVEPDPRALIVSGGGFQHGRLKVMDKMTPAQSQFEPHADQGYPRSRRPRTASSTTAFPDWLRCKFLSFPSFL